MLRARVIPCLLMKDQDLIKTVQFSGDKYIGDPVNAVKIFNEKEVDELIVLDIGATTQNAEPDYSMIRELAVECRMPFCYGGGVRSVDQAMRILSLGVEKVALSSSAINHPELVSEIAAQAGSQSVVVVMDVRKSKSGQYELFLENGRHSTGRAPAEYAAELQQLGVGEIVVNSIDRDGTMNGYDIPLIDEVHSAVTVPITAIGGAGSLDDIKELIRRYGIIGASAGSLFVFKGSYRAVLINYPGKDAKWSLLKDPGVESSVPPQ